MYKLLWKKKIVAIHKGNVQVQLQVAIRLYFILVHNTLFAVELFYVLLRWKYICNK